MTHVLETVSLFDAVGVGDHREARNVAAIQPDRIQTRWRDDGAWEQASRQANRSKLRDWSVPASDLIGTLRSAYHVVLQHNNGHPDRYWNPPYSLPSYSGRGSSGGRHGDSAGEWRYGRPAAKDLPDHRPLTTLSRFIW